MSIGITLPSLIEDEDMARVAFFARSGRLRK